MADDGFPVEQAGGQVVVKLPEHVEVSSAARLREQLLSEIDRGAAVLILDMSATVSCDHAAVEAVARAHQRASVSGTQLRLVVTAPVVRRVLTIEGLDRLVSIYPSLAAAMAAGAPGRNGTVSPWARAQAVGRPAITPASGSSITGVTPAVLWQLLDALGDGLALTASGGEIVLVNRRCAEMFGYQREELPGRPIETLVPASLRAAHREYRIAYEQAPEARPMGERARLVGLRSDGATFPVAITLSPVPTSNGRFVLAVIRDAAETRRSGDLADLARAAAAEHAQRDRELLDRVVHNLFQVGLSLQTAVDVPGEVARERIMAAVQQLDATIQEIRDYVFTDPGRPPPPQ